MAAANSILINIGARTADAVTGIEGVSRALRHQTTAAEKSKAVMQAMMPAALAVGAALVTGGAVAVAAASKQQQAFGALDSVFKGSSKSMQAWAAEQSKIGLSASQAGNAAALLGAQLKNSGASAAEAAAESQKLVGLGADLAATFGGPTTDAVDALSAAFKGEFDSLEKYGVSLKQSDVNAKLAANGQDKLTGAAKNAATAAAIQALIWEQTGDAQGQAGREAGTFAGAMGRLKAEGENAAAAFGEALLPAVSWAVDALAGFADWVQNNTGFATVLAGILGVVAGSVIAINTAMTIGSAVASAWGIVMQLAGRIAGLSSAQIATMSAATVLWSAVTTVATAVGSAFGAVIGFITSPIFLLIAAIVAVIAIGVLLWKNWDTIKAWLAAAWQWIVDTGKALWNGLAAFFSGLWDSIKSALSSAWESIKSTLANVWNGIKSALSSAWDSIKTAVSTGVTNVVTWVTGLPGKAIDGLKNLDRTLRQKGVDLIQGLFDGAKSIWTNITDWLGGLAGKAITAIGNVASSLYDKGKSLIQGFIDGIKSMAGAILDAILSILPNSVESVIRNVLGLSGSIPAPAGLSARSARSAPASSHTPLVTDEQLARAVYSLLMRSGVRNGRAVPAVL